MTRIALLTECRPFNPNRTEEEHLVSVGGNTGNNAYITALKDIFGADHLNYGQLDKALNEDMYDVFIVGNLSWIVENTELPPFYIDAFNKITDKGKKFIPISVGTQVHDYLSDFKYHPETLKLLQRISDQAIIACRGYYTAELLYKNGVRNIEVVGCPSLYHRKDPNFVIQKRNKFLDMDLKCATGITPWPNKRMDKNKIKQFFDYAISNRVDFIEQANTRWIEVITRSDQAFKERFAEYWNNYSKIFYNIDDWREYSRSLDFSFGGRFHGNVIPLLEGVPSLFISIDARTREMCDYFKFPTIDILDFNFDWTLNELYDMTDYTKFNQSYKQIYEKFVNYVQSNGLYIVRK